MPVRAVLEVGEELAFPDRGHAEHRAAQHAEHRRASDRAPTAYAGHGSVVPPATTPKTSAQPASSSAAPAQAAAPISSVASSAARDSPRCRRELSICPAAAPSPGA
jgi:hypothetical protein